MIEEGYLQIDKHQLRRAFERAAQTYDSVAILQNEVGERLLARLDVIKLKPKRVLDAGAGTGQTTKRLLRRYPHAKVFALDIALAMLHKTQGRCGWLRRPVLICADAESLPITADQIDLIYSNLTLQWCNDVEQTLREFHRVMTPGSLLMFTTFGPDTLKELRQAWSRTDRYVHVNTFIDMHDIGDALIQVGFADPVMDMEMLTLTYPDVLKLMQELKLLGAQNKMLGRSKGLTGKGRLSLVRHTYESFRTPDGILPASFEVLYGHAWKPQEDTAPKTNSRPARVEIPVKQIKQQ